MPPTPASCRREECGRHSHSSARSPEAAACRWESSQGGGTVVDATAADAPKSSRVVVAINILALSMKISISSLTSISCWNLPSSSVRLNHLHPLPDLKHPSYIELSHQLARLYTARCYDSLRIRHPSTKQISTWRAEHHWQQ